MRMTLRLVLFTLLLPASLFSQDTPAAWVQSVGNPQLTELLSQIEEEEAALPPLSPLSGGWFEAVEAVGDALLEAGVHRSTGRYEEVSRYLYERAAWAGLPSDRIRSYREDSERLLAVVADGVDERVVVAQLLSATPEAVEAGEVSESSVIDALRRLEIELLTSSELSEKAERAGRAESAVELVLEMREELSARDLPRWEELSTLFEEAAGAVEELRIPGEGGAGEITISGEEQDPQVGFPQEALLRLFAALDPEAVEMALRWDPQIALGAATFFDRYRWALAPVGPQAKLGALLFVIEEEETELYRELFRRRLSRRQEELELSQAQSSSEQLLEQLLGEARSVVDRYEERARKGDEEAARWALLSVLSHPYAQMVLFREGDEQLRRQLSRRVDSLYGEVDSRARDLIGLVARRHAVSDWSYEVTPIPDSFDRIVTARLLVEGEEESGSSLSEQLSEAYYRAFNLVTNPEQNEEPSGEGVAQWSMLHGQYFEPEVLRQGEPLSFREQLRPWFLQESRAEEPRAGFPFAYRGYQRIHFAQGEWLAGLSDLLPRRMRPRLDASLYLAGQEVGRFLDGERTLFAVEEALTLLMDAELLPPHFAWASSLEESRSRYATVSRAETTAALLDRLGEEFQSTEKDSLELDFAAAALETRLRRIEYLKELDLLDPEVGEQAVYDAWTEWAVSLLARPEWLRDALSLPEEWREEEFLSSEAAERFYRRLSAAGVDVLRREGAADE